MGSACVFHSQGTVGSLREGQDQFRWDSSSKPPQLLSICCTMDTVFSTCKQLCSFNLLTTREMRRTYTHFKARNTEAQPGLSNLLKILWLTNGTGGLRMVNLCLVLEEIARSFSKVVVLFHSPRSERFDSSQHHQHLLLSVFFVVAILVGV